MKINHIHAKAKSIEGWLSRREAEKLYELASKVDKEDWIVEIGCYKGLSTLYLAEGSKSGNGAQILSVDTFEGSAEHRNEGGKIWTYDDFMANIKGAGIENIVRPEKSLSAEAAKRFSGSIGLLFIDASHEYRDVVDDFNSWSPFLKDGGFVAMHDTIMWEGPKRASAELFFRSPEYRVLGFVHSLSYGTKTKKGAADYLSAECILCAKNLYEAAYRAKKLIFTA